MFLESDFPASMTIEQDFHGIRVIDDRLVPVLWSMSISLVGIEKEGVDPTENDFNINVAYQRLNFWLDSALNNVIVTNAHDDISVKLFSCKLTNSIMHLPEEPTDDIMIRTIHSKLVTLSDDDLLIGKIVLRGSDCKSSFIFNPMSIEDYGLPDPQEYIDETSIFDMPWWLRRDMDVHDLRVSAELDEEDRLDIIDKISTANLLRSYEEEIRKEIRPNHDPEIEVDLEDDLDKGPSWTPKIVK